MLTEKETGKFMEIYKAYFGKEISREEAYEQGVKLLRLIEIIYKPMTLAEYRQLQIRRKAMDNPQKS